MRVHGRWITSVGATALLLSACGEALTDEAVIEEPAIVEPVEGAEVARVILTARGVSRLDIRTARVIEVRNRLVVPSAAVLVDPDGTFWVYTNPEPLVFVRREIRIEDEEHGRAFLSDGPPPGTRVVSTGVAELYGTESGIGH
jgi:hypothetical protein